MSDELLGPLLGSSLRVENKTQLDEFLARPDAKDVVRAASFEEVFFAIKHVGLADSMELLPLVTGRQVSGFIDLDCWRKDAFVRRPFMEWVAAFIQSGPEETVRALSGIDEFVIALFLKDAIRVYEVERDDPPEGTQLIFTPDNRFAVESVDDNESAAIAMLVLDALFKYNPHLGSLILMHARYTTTIELEELAFENKNRRLEVHGFVDYYEALSIYAGPREVAGTSIAVDRERLVEDVPGEESPGNLPALFADSLSGAPFLLKAFAYITDPDESDRLAHELTALGNRILSANLVNFGEMDSIRPALEEMRDVLAVGLEAMTGGRPEMASGVLRKSYMQTIFKVGFDQIARLREETDAIMALPGFKSAMLDPEDQKFLEGLRQFKPLLLEGAGHRNFKTLADVELAGVRLKSLAPMVRVFLQSFPSVTATFEKTFNTATVRFAIGGKFESTPLLPGDLEAFLAGGFKKTDVEVPIELRAFATRWAARMEEELTPLAGKKIDPRFVETVLVKL